MENFKRPDHPDFMDSSELAGIEFSGLRHNSISDYMEFWVLGRKLFELSSLEYRLYPEKWAALYEEHLGCNQVEIINQKGN
jgi:hypothetical protein